MLISDAIAQMIEQMLDEGGGSLELRRNDLAGKLGCVPSQINYVITSRFTPERGYIIESRRGGGGYIRIVRREMQKNEYLMHAFHAVGSEIDHRTLIAFVRNLYDRGLLGEREARIVSGVSNAVENDAERADVLRQVLLAIMD